MSETPIFQPLQWLQEAGFSAYLVGNQVRDRLLGTSSERADVDIATSATPEQVAMVLAHHRIHPSLIDAKFGVVAFGYNGFKFELTTFRRDIYKKEFAEVKRYPDEIKFIKSAAKDAVRRDITINAIYYNPSGGRYLDYVGGLEDIKTKTIRVIGAPAVRFQEDPIRMLRVIRMKHQLDFSYHPTTKTALASSAHLLGKLSPSVVKKELQKLQSIKQYPAARQDLVKFGFIKVI
jgi:poly(A) polymerase